MHKLHSILLISIALTISFNTEAQTPETVHFEYDAAGNRIARFVYRSMSASESDSVFVHNEKIADLLAEEEEKTKAPAEAFRIFPNPTRNFFTVTHTATTDEVWNYQLFSAGGVMMDQGALNRLPHEIDVAGIPQGTYYLRISSSTETQTFSIIKL